LPWLLAGQKPRQSLIEGMGNGEGKKELTDLGLAEFFSYPKPLMLLTHICKMFSKSAVFLDFFAGSGTTAHAVMQLNAEDKGSRQCILVTNNEGPAGAGICAKVTYPRLKKAIEGYRTSKGKEVTGLGENLEFFRTAFQPIPESLDQTRSFFKFSTFMLCLKSGCFQLVEENKHWAIFQNAGKHLFVLFDEYANEAALKRLKELIGPIEAYVFAYERDDDTAELLRTLHNVTVQEVPQPLLDLFHRLKE